MEATAHPFPDRRYRALLALLSHVPGLEDLAFCYEAEPEAVFAAILEPWASVKVTNETRHQTRLEALEGELTALQALLSNIQSEFLLHTVQRQVST